MNNFSNLGPAIQSETIGGNVTNSTNIFLNFNSWLGSWFKSPKQKNKHLAKATQDENTSYLSASFEWKIENFQICRSKPCDKLVSAVFHVNDSQVESDWQLVIYPNGNSKNIQNFLSVYLLLKRSKQVEVTCQFATTLNAVIEEHFCKTFAEGTTDGNSTFTSTSHPQIQTKDLCVECKLNLFLPNSESDTSENAKSECSLTALSILSGEYYETFTWKIYNFQESVDPATYTTQFETVYESTTLRWQLKLVYIGTDLNPKLQLQLLSLHKVNEIPSFIITFTVIDSEKMVIKSRSLDPHQFTMNSEAELTEFVDRDKLYTAKNYSILCVLRCPVNYVTVQEYPSTLRSTFNRNEIDSSIVGLSMLDANLTFKPVIWTFKWTIKNFKRMSDRVIASPIIFIEQPKSQWVVFVRHIEANDQVGIYTRINSRSSPTPNMSFRIGIGDQFIDGTYNSSDQWLTPIFLPPSDSRIVNDDWTICCIFNLMTNTCLTDDTIPIELERSLCTVIKIIPSNISS